MAGSYWHCVDRETGKLLSNHRLLQMLDTGGDVFEAIEELYGMIHYLAGSVALTTDITRDDVVQQAQDHYREGLELAGVLPWDDA